MRRKYGWRNGPPIGLWHFLGDITCTVIGHHAPQRATEAWDVVRRDWFVVADDASIVYCRRCRRTLNGWSLWGRYTPKPSGDFPQC